MKSFLLVLCVALSVVGCNSSKNMAKLSGVKWVLQTLNDKELSLTDPNSEIFEPFEIFSDGSDADGLSRPTDRNGIFPNAGWCRRLFDQRQQTFFPV